MSSVFISVLVVIVVLALQLRAFYKTNKDRNNLRNIFPDNPDETLSFIPDEDSASSANDDEHVIRIHGTTVNPIFSEQIVAGINEYLKENKGSADFSVLKDITDRNCDIIEERIDTTSPFPIYLGLCGTLAGIVLGVAILAFGGGLDALLGNSGPSVSASLGGDGIKNLLRGVAVAMGTTLFGVIFTIIGSDIFKDASSENERKKNLFLSWMQRKLLPQMNDSLAKTFSNLQKNLTKFNREFAKNSENLNGVFAGVNLNFEQQAEVLRAIKELNITQMAEANIRVLNDLKECTDKLQTLQKFLNKSNQYLTEVQSLNSNLGAYEAKLQGIEGNLIDKLNGYFAEEAGQFKSRTAAINESVAELDKNMRKSLEDFEDYTKEKHTALKAVLADEQKKLSDAIEEQQKALNAKLTETAKIVSGLNSFVEMNESVTKLTESSMRQEDQNKSILASMGIMTDAINSMGQRPIPAGQPGIPKKSRLVLLIGGGVIGVVLLIAAGCLIRIVNLLGNA